MSSYRRLQPHFQSDNNGDTLKLSFTFFKTNDLKPTHKITQLLFNFEGRTFLLKESLEEILCSLNLLTKLKCPNKARYQVERTFTN